MHIGLPPHARTGMEVDARATSSTVNSASPKIPRGCVRSAVAGLTDVTVSVGHLARPGGERPEFGAAAATLGAVSRCYRA